MEHGDAHCIVVMAQKAEGTPSEWTVALSKKEASVAHQRQTAREAWLCNTKGAPLTPCLAEVWDKDYAKSEYLATHWEASSEPQSELSWPAGLGVDDRKLFVFDKMRIRETGMDQVVQE